MKSVAVITANRARFTDFVHEKLQLEPDATYLHTSAELYVFRREPGRLDREAIRFFYVSSVLSLRAAAPPIAFLYFGFDAWNRPDIDHIKALEPYFGIYEELQA